MILTLIIAMSVPLRCLQGTNTGYLPCYCCYFYSGGKQEADVNVLTGTLLSRVLGNANRGI